jgi:hypothetical protein
MTSAPFLLTNENISAVPILHYKMEFASEVNRAFHFLRPDCIAVEFPSTIQLQVMHAASRLPDISVIARGKEYIMFEPCDGGCEAARLSLDNQIPLFCVDYPVENYPEHHESFPDSYAIHKIGLAKYYKAYQNSSPHSAHPLDQQRELFMAKQLQMLSEHYEKVLFIGGLAHIERIFKLLKQENLEEPPPPQEELAQVYTLTEKSCQEVMAECGWNTERYEEERGMKTSDRQRHLLDLYNAAADKYSKEENDDFPKYHLRNLMKFSRNYAMITGQLIPDLFQILSSAKGCVDHNYAYHCWELATRYSHRRNIDGLQELNLSIEEVWGHSKLIRFHRREKSRKRKQQFRQRKDKSSYRFDPPNPYTICSYPPEDSSIEGFGDFLKKKGTHILSEEGSHAVPFSTSLEDGVDTRETIRHWAEKKLYVKVQGKPPGGVGSIVVVFDEDMESDTEKYPWKTTWLGEHEQESDMAFYSTEMGKNLVGPGICRCSYGGFVMSYPPRRMFNIWMDQDYSFCESKSEVLLTAAIDYAVKPLVVYVAAKPPKSSIKQFAQRYGKKVVYIPIGQLSPVTLKKIKNFHVLDGQARRSSADDYI